LLNADQIKLIHVAVKAAGMNNARYRLLLTQYTQANGARVKSCKQMNNRQVDDLLAICESLGWRHPVKPENFYRQKVQRDNHGMSDTPSFAARSAVLHLAEDLGWGKQGLKQMIDRITKGRTDSLSLMTHREIYNLIEASKAMISRLDKKAYKTLTQIRDAKQPLTEECHVQKETPT